MENWTQNGLRYFVVGDVAPDIRRRSASYHELLDRRLVVNMRELFFPAMQTCDTERVRLKWLPNPAFFSSSAFLLVRESSTRQGDKRTARARQRSMCRREEDLLEVDTIKAAYDSPWLSEIENAAFTTGS